MDNEMPTQINGFHDLLGRKLCISMYKWLGISLFILLLINIFNISINVSNDNRLFVSFPMLMFAALGALMTGTIIKDGKEMIKNNKRELAQYDVTSGQTTLVTEISIFNRIVASIIFFTIVLAIISIFNVA